MKKNLFMVAVVCFATLSLNAQTGETETKGQKYFRLTKTADDNPTDWKAQLEAGHFLLDKENGMYKQQEAGKYYERLYHLATDYNKEIPDSVVREAGMMLMTVAADNKDLDKSLFYVDEMLHAQKVGVDIGEDNLISVGFFGVLYSIMKQDMFKALSYMMDIRKRLTQQNFPGIEHTDVTTIALFENLMKEYKKMFSDKLIEVDLDGKKYVMVSSGEWNIEKPFMGWQSKWEDTPMLLYGEDGKVYDDKHGMMEYGFNFFKGVVVPKPETNMRLITVTPERRQQMVKAYHKYMGDR